MINLFPNIRKRKLIDQPKEKIEKLTFRNNCLQLEVSKYKTSVQELKRQLKVKDAEMYLLEQENYEVKKTLIEANQTIAELNKKVAN